MLNLPRIPREEYPRRWNAVQEMMKEQNLEVLIAYADDHFTYGAAYARYYADFSVAFEPVLILFLQEGDPILLCGPESDGYAKITGVISDIRVLQEFTHEDEDYLFASPEKLSDIVKESIGESVEKLGLAGRNLMSAPVYEAVVHSFPNAEVVDMDECLGSSRGVKTDAELEVIRYAYEIAHHGMMAAIEAIRPGVTEREIAAQAEFAMRRMGSEGTGIDTIIASGINSNPILGKTRMREIKEDDVVIVTVAPRYEGYHGAIGRTIIVGNPEEKIVKAIEAEVKAQIICGNNLIAGRIGSEVEAMGREVMKEAGYGNHFLYSGLHSVGVVEFEPPIFGPSSKNVLQDNMVISVDIPLFETGEFGARTEDGYIIKGETPICLTRIDKFIRK